MTFTFKKIIILLLTLALSVSFAVPGLCASSGKTYDFAGKTLDEIMDDFMCQYSLGENNFAMGYYNTGTGEEWYYGADNYLPAGSMYKLPLNMIFSEYITEGIYSRDDEIGDYTLDRALYLSLVHSDNDAAQSMRAYISDDLTEYRNELAKYSGIDVDELPGEYYTANCMSPRFLLNTLKYLYSASSLYVTVTEYMKLAQPGYYFRKYVSDYTVAQKYGNFGTDLNCCGIIYTPDPIILVVFTKGVSGSEGVIGALAELFTEYEVYLDEQKALAESAQIEALKDEQRKELQMQNALEEAGWLSALEAERKAADKAAQAARLQEIQMKLEAEQERSSRVVCTAAMCVIVLAAGIFFGMLRKERREIYKGKH